MLAFIGEHPAHKTSTMNSPNTLLARQKLAEAELFAVHFVHWRSAIFSATAFTAVLAWIFFYITRAPNVWWWLALNAGAYLLQAITCYAYERRAPGIETPAYRNWQRVWIVQTFFTGIISGSLIWALPQEQTAVLITAAVICAMFAMAEASAGGFAALAYAAVFSQTLTVSAALIFHADMPYGVLVCGVFAALVLHFGLQLNRSMLDAIEQRLHAEQLAKEVTASRQHLLAAERQQDILFERQRVMQDMHDGLGSSLASSLIVMERGELSVAEATTVMRECVDDLRLVVDSLEPTSKDLSTLLGMLRYRLQRRIEAAGVRLHWQMMDLPSLTWLEPSLALDLLRLVQEAIANTLNHASATKLELIAEHTDQAIELTVRDNGKGFDAATNISVGRGMRSMQMRADRLGAQLQVRSDLGVGTAVSIRLPKDKTATVIG
jgi:signal transduction histidine kinase